MKKIKTIIVIVLSFIIVFFAIFFVSQKDNIRAIFLAFQYSNNEIENKIKENDEILSNYLDSYLVDISNENGQRTDDIKNQSKADTQDTITQDKGNEVKENTTKSQNEFNSKQSTQTEKILEEDIDGAVEKCTDKTVESDKSNEKSPSKDSATSIIESEDNTYEKEIISKYVNQMFAVKLEFTNYLNDVEKQVYDDYVKLAKEDRDLEHKKDIILKYYNYVADLEKKCDLKVEQIIKALKKELENQKMSTSIVDDIKKVYENEKALKKAYYIKLYKEGK